MKRFFILLLALLLTMPALADQGMWLPSLISQRIDDMRAKGFRLTAEDIYSINRASMKDAVMLFGGGCTAELVSAEGLLLTNHHCGYDAIAAHSSLEHDRLTNGFWAMSRAEELPNPKLNVKFLVRMEEVTDALAAGETREAMIAEAVGEGKGYKASIEQMYYGNQFFLFVWRQFDDVRLVAAPPSSIGKFGGDTDNWMWPRHTGDFSVFRIYADRNNEPAAYCADNVPYRPPYHFKISTAEVSEGDFTMIYGFPGNTQYYILSDAVAYVAERSDPAKIAIRTGRLDIISKAQESDPALRIYYASKHADIANSWKKWQGELLGIERMNAVAEKRAYERRFAAWAQDKPEYRRIIPQLEAEYKRIGDAYFAHEILTETLRTLPRSYTGKDRAEREATERALFEFAFMQYAAYTPKAYRVPMTRSPKAYADRIFDEIWQGGATPAADALFAAVKQKLGQIDRVLGSASRRNLNSTRLNGLYTTYVRGLREWDTGRAFFPDANLTLRVSYGKIAGYEDAYGTRYAPQTTLDELIAKDNPEIYDYDIPQALRDLYAAKDYGRWGTTIDGHYTVPVCFLADTHTTGGNSGSPMLDADGELVGINFDRTWRSTMSDIVFDESICRNIAVDIRYVMFVIEKVGHAGYLFDEMDFTE